MTGPETIKINGVTVRASEVEWTDTRENGSKGVMFKTGVFALVQNVKQDPNATLYSETNAIYNQPMTLGYYLNGVTIEGSKKSDIIHLRDSQKCFIDTNATGWTQEAENDNIQLTYTKGAAQKNTVATDSKDQLTVLTETYPRKETKHNGQLNGLY